MWRQKQGRKKQEKEVKAKGSNAARLADWNWPKEHHQDLLHRGKWEATSVFLIQVALMGLAGVKFQQRGFHFDPKKQMEKKKHWCMAVNQYGRLRIDGHVSAWAEFSSFAFAIEKLFWTFQSHRSNDDTVHNGWDKWGKRERQSHFTDPSVVSSSIGLK